MPSSVAWGVVSVIAPQADTVSNGTSKRNRNAAVRRRSPGPSTKEGTAASGLTHIGPATEHDRRHVVHQRTEQERHGLSSGSPPDGASIRPACGRFTSGVSTSPWDGLAGAEHRDARLDAARDRLPEEAGRRLSERLAVEV